MCNSTITIDLTTPQVCRYTTLWNVSVLKATRSTQRAQTSAERQHNSIAEWSFCNANYLCSFDLSPPGIFSIIQWIRTSDFGLIDPNGDPDRNQNLTTWSLGHALLLQEISSKSVHNFFSYPTDRQTDKTDRSKNTTSFFGGGNNNDSNSNNGNDVWAETNSCA